MRTLKLAGIIATGCSLALVAAPAQAAPTAKPGDTATVQATDSITCGKGVGGNAKVNFSWKKGKISTKIYFNNHCKKNKKITAAVVMRNYSSVVGWEYVCVALDTNGKTKGNKKFKTDYYNVWRVERGHKTKWCKVR